MKSIFFSFLLLSMMQSQMGASPVRFRDDWNGENDTSLFFVSFDSTRIHYEIRGKGSPVLLIHGFIADGESWKKVPLYDDLLKAGFQVITLDLRGNGQSGRPHRPEDYAHDAQAKDIMALMDLLRIHHYDVVGYSRGSIITARLLVLDQRVTCGVMGGMGADFTNPDWPRRILFYRALMGEPVKELEEMVKHIQSSGLDQLALAYQQKEQPSTSKEELARLGQRVLIICGDQDSDNGSSSELVKLIPKATHANVPGDHGGAVRSPEFSQQVISFLTANTPPFTGQAK